MKSFQKCQTPDWKIELRLLQIREILRGNSALGLKEAARSIQERNENSVKLMKAAQVVMVMVMGAADVMVLFMMEAASRQRVRILFHKCDFQGFFVATLIV